MPLSPSVRWVSSTVTRKYEVKGPGNSFPAWVTVRRIGRGTGRVGHQLHQESWPARGDFHLQNIPTPRVQWGMKWVSLDAHINSSPVIGPSVTATLAQSWVKSAGVSHMVWEQQQILNHSSCRFQIQKAVRASGSDGQGRAQKDKRGWKDFVCKNGLFWIMQRVCGVLTSTSHSIWKKSLRRVQLNTASAVSEGLASLLLFVLLHMTMLDARLSISLGEVGECTGGPGEGMEQAALGERPDRSHTDSHWATTATPLQVSAICWLQCESH